MENLFTETESRIISQVRKTLELQMDLSESIMVVIKGINSEGNEELVAINTTVHHSVHIYPTCSLIRNNCVDIKSVKVLIAQMEKF